VIGIPGGRRGAAEIKIDAITYCCAHIGILAINGLEPTDDAQRRRKKIKENEKHVE